MPNLPLEQAVDVDPGATCFDPGRIVSSVQAWLARDHVSGDVRVHVRGDPQRPNAASFRIVRAGKTRERRFEALPVECEDATAVVGLAVAMAIDAERMKDIVGPLPGASPRAPSAFTVQGVVGFEVLPGVAVGGAAGAELGIASWLSARLDVFELSSWGNAVAGARGVFDAYLGAASPQLCAGGDIGSGARFELCPGLPVGVVFARGRDFAASHASAGFWLEASVGARLTFVAGIPWKLDVVGVFPVRVPSFEAETAAGSDVYRNPSAAGALLSFGPSFNL